MEIIENLSLKFTHLQPQLVWDNSVESSPSSVQLIFYISYVVQHKFSDDGEPWSDSKNTRAVPFHSDTVFWNANLELVCRDLSEKFRLLGIGSQHHRDLILRMARSLRSMINSGMATTFQQHPVLALAIKVINVKTYFSLKRVKDEQGRKVCSICLEEIGANGASTDCGHVFHCGCITKWLDRGEYCPICKKKMPGFVLMVTRTN